MAQAGFVAATGIHDDTQSSGDGGRIDRATEPIVGAAGAVAGAAKDLLHQATGALGVDKKPRDDPFVLTIIGIFLVVICVLATLLLAQIVHARNTLHGR